MSFIKGDRVRVVGFDNAPCKDSQQKYQGIEGTVTHVTLKTILVKIDNKFLRENFAYTYEGARDTDSWHFVMPRWNLELIDDGVIEEDWS